MMNSVCGVLFMVQGWIGINLCVVAIEDQIYGLVCVTGVRIDCFIDFVQ